MANKCFQIYVPCNCVIHNLGLLFTACVFDLNGAFADPDPIFLRPGQGFTQLADLEKVYILPNASDGLLHLEKEKSIRIACPGRKLSLTGQVEALATCGSDGKLVSSVYFTFCGWSKVRFPILLSGSRLARRQVFRFSNLIVTNFLSMKLSEPKVWQRINRQ